MERERERLKVRVSLGEMKNLLLDYTKRLSVGKMKESYDTNTIHLEDAFWSIR